MALNVPGLVATLIFYVLVLAIGLWASLQSRRDQARTQAAHTDMALLGNRKINLLVGIFTTTGESHPAVFFILFFLPEIASILATVQTSTFLKKNFSFELKIKGAQGDLSRFIYVAVRWVEKTGDHAPWWMRWKGNQQGSASVSLRSTSVFISFGVSTAKANDVTSRQARILPVWRFKKTKSLQIRLAADVEERQS